MYSRKFRILLVVSLAIAWGVIISIYFLESARIARLKSRSSKAVISLAPRHKDKAVELNEADELLRVRNDKEAMKIYEMVLAEDPQNLPAMQGKAEVLRRARKFKDAEELYNRMEKIRPGNPGSLIGFGYIEYQAGRMDQAQKNFQQALKAPNISKRDQAIAYMLLGAVNSQRSQGWLFNKLVYGTQIKGYFLKAYQLAPELPEVHMSMGTYYLKAPAIAGGNLDQALKELNIALEIAPDFATTNARLAQAYKAKGDLKNYNKYLQRTKQLDPENEVLPEIEGSAQP
jgi:Tfp pilus assembly protein PilF